MKLRMATVLTVCILAAGTVGEARAQNACCLIDGCQPAADESQCAAMGGILLPGQDCADDPCAIGACCFKLACGKTDAFNCIINGRIFAGAGTSCLDDPCESGAGACCTDGVCGDLSPEDCTVGGGTWLGAGTNCDTDHCIIGACCAPGRCDEIAFFECSDRGGDFHPQDTCDQDPCLVPLDCPTHSLYSQTRDGPDFFTAYTSEFSAGLQRWDNFSEIIGPIDALTWWGLELRLVGGNWVECDESDPQFAISFHHDDAGSPGKLVCSDVVAANRTLTGVDYQGTDLIEYQVILPHACVITNGWISIHGLGDTDGDGDVDLPDFATMLDCFTGPDGGPPQPGCLPADTDRDGDVDFADFRLFQLVFTGSQ